MPGIILTLSIAGLLAGFIFSMPIAGPVSILVTSNALKGKLKYCYLLTIGASFADLVYVFIAVFGLTRFYSTYKPVIPYIMLIGSAFVIFTGYRIFRTRIDPAHLEDNLHMSEKIKKRSSDGFYTGLLINFLNPTLFFGWLTTSFIVISIVSSLGFNTGGLESTIENNIQEINNIGSNVVKKPELPGYLHFDTLQILKKENHNAALKKKEFRPPRNYHLVISACFAAALSLGSILWFMLLAFSLYRFRKVISIRVLNLLINALGVFLCLAGAFILYKALAMIIS